MIILNTITYMNNVSVIPLVIHTRGVVMFPCAQALNNLFGRSLCLLSTWERKALNVTDFTSSRCSFDDVMAQ